MFIAHSVKHVSPLDNYEIVVTFSDGIVKIYDVKPCFEKWKIFNSLKENGLFKKVTVADGGFGVKWNSKIDLDDEELYERGKLIDSPFNGLLSFSEASEMWNLSESTLRKAVQYKRFKTGIDIMKFGKQWVITTSAMIKEYGPQPKRKVENY